MKYIKTNFCRLTWSLGPVCCWFGSVWLLCLSISVPLHVCLLITTPHIHAMFTFCFTSILFIIHPSAILFWFVVGVAWGSSSYFGVCFCWCSMGETPMLLCTWFCCPFSLCGRDHWAGFMVWAHLIGSHCMDFLVRPMGKPHEWELSVVCTAINLVGFSLLTQNKCHSHLLVYIEWSCPRDQVDACWDVQFD